MRETKIKSSFINHYTFNLDWFQLKISYWVRQATKKCDSNSTKRKSSDQPYLSGAVWRAGIWKQFSQQIFPLTPSPSARNILQILPAKAPHKTNLKNILISASCNCKGWIFQTQAFLVHWLTATCAGNSYSSCSSICLAKPYNYKGGGWWCKRNIESEITYIWIVNAVLKD